MPDQHTAHAPKTVERDPDDEVETEVDAAGAHCDNGQALTRAPENAAIELQINALLDDPSPADWNDPVMVSLRTRMLERVACKAGEAMIELLVRLHDERARDVHMREGNCVLTCTDALFKLHRALCVYTRDTLRHDGEEVARDAIVRVHGAGVAVLTKASLDEVRKLIIHEMRAV
jgi:hypothetical protein